MHAVFIHCQQLKQNKQVCLLGIHDLKHIYEIKGENAVAIVPRTGDIDKLIGFGAL